MPSEAEAEESSSPQIEIVYLLHLLSLPDVFNYGFEETLYCVDTDITDICTVGPSIRVRAAFQISKLQYFVAVSQLGTNIDEFLANLKMLFARI